MGSMKMEGDYATHWEQWTHRIASLMVVGAYYLYLYLQNHHGWPPVLTGHDEIGYAGLFPIWCADLLSRSASAEARWKPEGPFDRVYRGEIGARFIRCLGWLILVLPLLMSWLSDWMEGKWG